MNQQMICKTGIEELSELGSIVLCFLRRDWDLERQKNVYLFYYKLFALIDIPSYVVYASLNYMQTVLANNHDMDDYSLVTVTLLLAYKYTEDYPPPFMLQWSYVSMIPVNTLVKLESALLRYLDYSLYISSESFLLWTEKCNVLCDLPFFSEEPAAILNNDTYYPYYYSPPLTPTLYPQVQPIAYNDNISPLLYNQDLIDLYSQDSCSVPIWMLYSQPPQVPITMNDMWYPFL
ncbi:hypothetical protein BY458DRAFT_487182 [Sporodiniella umbellata]|nr:hypothetical protein BY458DRAFT_487182 [Sporodiniella umbellata]